MYIKQMKGYVVKDSVVYNVSKGLLDYFDPSTQPSLKYNHWVAVLDLKTCLICREQHGKIYEVGELIDTPLPVHNYCRCSIQRMDAVLAGGATSNGLSGADWWLKNYGELPDYYITREELYLLGWRDGDKPSKYAPNKMFTKGVYDNDDGHLPQKEGRVWYEADINYTPGRRNRHRIVWSNDGLVFVTYDHYETFYEII